jgi:selenocysteine-specific translation elongation factor
MNHLTVGVFHDDTIARELGKKGTESDILMFNRKTDEHIFTFMSPVEDKLSPKSQIISSIDAAIVAFTGKTRELGETLVMLDSLGVTRGIAVTTPYATPDQVRTLTKGTALESYNFQNRDTIGILENLKSVHTERDTVSPAIVEIDHSFSVRGVGEVALGFVKKGIVRKYDKLMLLPAGKEVIVRSIQIQDEDYDVAQAGIRVGLAIKGATVEEMKRGSILCASNNVITSSKLKLSVSKSPFYTDELREGAFHATIGMQTAPITITEKNASSINIELEKPVVYTPESIFLLLDLNAKKMRIMGKARAQQD